jgi:hypothetical protein
MDLQRFLQRRPKGYVFSKDLFQLLQKRFFLECNLCALPSIHPNFVGIATLSQVSLYSTWQVAFLQYCPKSKPLKIDKYLFIFFFQFWHSVFFLTLAELCAAAPTPEVIILEYTNIVQDSSYFFR